MEVEWEVDLEKPLDKEEKGMSIAQFSLLKVIGKGSFAEVLLAKKTDSGRVYAIKKLKKKVLEKRKQVEHVMSQRRALAHFDHPFIIKLFYSFRSEKCLFFVLEYCPGGELFNLLQKKKHLREEEAKFYAAQMVLALEHIHSKNIIYRDLKPENVVFDSTGYIRLTDFGLCKENISIDNQAKSICGTPQYMAPEVLYKQGHGRPVDWWCLGSIIFEMLTGLPPFFSTNKPELFDKIKFDKPAIPAKFSEDLKGLLLGLFQKNPEKRFGAEEVKRHPWFKNVDWKLLLQKKVKPPYVPVLKSEEDTDCFDPQFTAQQISYSFDGSSFSSDSKKFDKFDFDGDQEGKQIQFQMEEK